MRRQVSPGRSGAVVVAVVAALVSAGASAGASSPAVAVAEPAPPASPAVRAASAADALVAGRPEALRAGPDDGFVRQPVQSSMGWEYVPFLRSYKGLPVLGGDFVVVVRDGVVSSTSVAQETAIRGLDVVPAVTRQAAERLASGRLAPGFVLEGVPETRLVVDATGAKPRLAWESTVAGNGGPKGPSLLEVVVDADSGTVVRAEEQVRHDVGHSGLNGERVEVPSARVPCTLPACPSWETYKLGYAAGGMSCSESREFDPAEAREWGDGNPTNPETACVDMTFASVVQNAMLADWLGRSGLTGGGANSGFALVTDAGVVDNAFYSPSRNPPEVHIGRTSNGVWLASLDIVGHENGHGIDHHTPSGFSHSTTAEFVADAFGLATEWYANRPAPYDTPDYVQSDNSALSQSAKRYFHNPALNGRAVNCYGGITTGTRTHDAAGVGDHWLYLLAEGSNPSNGQPVSPTCNGSTVSGIGLRAAMQVLYHAMLMKTSDSTYPSYRSWTLTAARNLFPHDCGLLTRVRQAWDAVGVPQQPGDPACAVPSIVGQSHQAAHGLISASGLTLGSMTGQVSHAPLGTVLSQSPAPGVLLPVNTPVSFTFSAPGPVQVPHVFGRSCAEASNMIRAVVLVPSCTGAGPKVTGVSPMVGSWPTSGSVVTLTLSTVRHVPDVVGVSCSTALGWLEDNDLVGQCTGSGPVVTRQTPGAGIAVTVGALVQLSTTARPRPPGCPDAGTQACPRP